jgi:excisionase family DNA binding protein
LTTQNAADVLGVSRPFIVKQIESGLLPHRMVGTHRRILFRDLMEYKHKMEADRDRALGDLAAESQRLGLY